MKLRTKILMVLAAAALVVVGRWSAGSGDAPARDAQHDHASDSSGSEQGAPTLWTCPMHPQIKLPDPGPCPICSMDLVPLASDGDDHPRRMVMSPAAKQLAEIVSLPVVRKNVTRPTRMVGKIDYDETAVRTISAWVPGRLDRLFVDYTGVRVAAGDHLVRLYSPELLSAQQELLSVGARQSTTAGEQSPFLTGSNRRSLESAREKLILWGLTEQQVATIEARGTAEDYVMLTSPSSGIVIEKYLDEGAYVQTGTHIYKIADLTRLWLRLDAYEQDLTWLRYGQRVTFEVEALPGEVFEGDISYIDPFIHEHTRTAKVRVNLDNSRGRLKPGMFVRAVAATRLGADGVVLDRALAGKWVSPMHPEIVKDAPGSCDVCGMDLVRAEDLGLVSDAVPAGRRPLVVPDTAVLVTGKRAVVYVDVPGTDRPTFEGREIVLGPRAGDEYVVLAGLAEGERVVVNGAFRIDSSMQIRAKPSMMGMPAETAALRGPEARVFRESLEPLHEAYLAWQGALAADDLARARTAMDRLLPTLERPSAAGLPSSYRSLWKEEREALTLALEQASDRTDLEGLRVLFEAASNVMIRLAREFGNAVAEPLNEAHCPMAFDGRGASWLQLGEGIANPYFGAAMPRCGELRESFAPRQDAPSGGPVEHADHAGHGSSATPVPAPESERASSDAPTQVEPPAAAPRSADPGLAAVFEAYLATQVELAADDAEGGRAGLASLLVEVLAATAEQDREPAVAARLDELQSALMGVDESDDLAQVREVFHDASKSLIALESVAGNPTETDLSIVHCPMAFDFTGADWIQGGEEVSNPYFGASMLRCGSVERVTPGR